MTLTINFVLFMISAVFLVLSGALKINKRLIVKNSPKLLDYLKTRIGKDIFD